MSISKTKNKNNLTNKPKIISKKKIIHYGTDYCPPCVSSREYITKNIVHSKHSYEYISLYTGEPKPTENLTEDSLMKWWVGYNNEVGSKMAEMDAKYDTTFKYIPVFFIQDVKTKKTTLSNRDEVFALIANRN